jgi:hypothetical protein
VLSDKLYLHHIGLISVKGNFVTGRVEEGQAASQLNQPHPPHLPPPHPTAVATNIDTTELFHSGIFHTHWVEVNRDIRAVDSFSSPIFNLGTKISLQTSLWVRFSTKFEPVK